MLRGEIRELKKRLRELCFSYKEELTQVETVVDQYNLLYDVQERARMEFRKKLKTRDVLYEVGKIFGISTQTLYRARSAVKSARAGQEPKKYAKRTFNNIKYNLKSR